MLKTGSGRVSNQYVWVGQEDQGTPRFGFQEMVLSDDGAFLGAQQPLGHISHSLGLL